MRRWMAALVSLYRRWRFVEEDLPTLSVVPVACDVSDPVRTRRAIERGERLLDDYRRNGCHGLARDCETSLRSLRSHLAALKS